METFCYFVLVVFALILVVVALFHFLTRKYVSPYTLTFIFAKKGQGKSTLLTKTALQHLAAGWTVYSTDPVPGCYYVPAKDVGYYEFEPHSLLIIDEIGMIWDNRGFKDFPTEVRDWFKLQRHRKVKVVCASQSFDVDKKIRDLADDMFLLQKKFRVFSYGKRILKILDIVEADGTKGSESRIVDQLKFDSLLWFWLGSRKLTYIPRWAPYFDTFAAPPLKEKTWKRDPMPEKLPRSLQKRSRSRRRVSMLPPAYQAALDALKADIVRKASDLMEKLKNGLHRKSL